MSYYYQNIGWIRCSLNYGREHVEHFCKQVTPYHSVLDIGAGPGEDLFSAQKIHPEARLHAVEVNPESIRRLRAGGVEVYPINIERQRLPLADRSIDLVIMNQVLEHVKDIYWIFHEISRVLPVGGSLILGVPNLASLHNRILLGLGLQPTCIKTNSAHVRGFTRGDILQFLGEVFPGGYQLAGFRGANFYPLPPNLARPVARLFPNLAWGMFMLFEKRRPYQQEFLEAPVIQELETNYFLGKNEDCPDSRFSF
jgi:ubiquinone/menaquinone biosynthesis C-methylase UbiE